MAHVSWPNNQKRFAIYVFQIVSSRRITFFIRLDDYWNRLRRKDTDGQLLYTEATSLH